MGSALCPGKRLFMSPEGCSPTSWLESHFQRQVFEFSASFYREGHPSYKGHVPAVTTGCCGRVTSILPGDRSSFPRVG